MPKKVLQDITSRSEDLRKKKFIRKWDYSNGSDGIVNHENKKTSVKHAIEKDKDDFFSEKEDIQSDRDGDNVEEIMNEDEKEASYFDNYSEFSEGKSLSCKKKKGFIIGSLIIFIILFFFISNTFANATVEVVLLQQSVPMQEKEFTVEKGAINHTFQMQIINERQSVNIPAINEEEVYEKASGQIVIFNEYSKTSQRLVANTRFQSPEGKVYRISSAVVIPGYTMSGTEIVPGSLEVKVTADQPGEEYNTPRADFTVPGLKDTDLYEKVYAHSKTSISGGYAGVLRTAKPEDVEKAKIDLEKKLNESLMTQIYSYVGTDKILYNDAIFTQFESKILNADDAANVTVEGQLTLYAAIFSRNDLSSFIAEEGLSSYDGTSVTDTNIENLTFLIKNKDEFDFVQGESFTFTLSGQSHLVWNIDEDELKAQLAGSKLTGDNFSNIVKKHASIRKADPKVSPFWKRTFPKDPEKINLVQVTE